LGLRRTLKAQLFAIENNPPASGDESLSSPDPVAKSSFRLSHTAGAAKGVSVSNISLFLAISVPDVLGDKASRPQCHETFATLPLKSSWREEPFVKLIDPFLLWAE
jgi:hypothetical protein